uniref:Global nitrogen transcriptional regulator n=1 Tax=Balbiania investiens TaxID=111861 RepID=A0A4D6BKS1_9FLOR|nr:global nitrogen transcriptional regulator [Balbiania investiens]QBX88572.1 global nitrogen transcriptional regulator [Balbiania investiens]
MPLLHILSQKNILTLTYTLKAGDAVIIHSSNNFNIYLILEGALILSKVFTNREIISFSILKSQDIVITSFKDLSRSNFFYKVEALADTYLLSFNHQSIQPYEKIIAIQNYQTSLRYTYMTEILAHRNTKDRLIHLLLILSELFGVVNKSYINIPLNISKLMLASIIGSNRNTVGQLISQLEYNRSIRYSKQKIIIYDMVSLINSTT